MNDPLTVAICLPIALFIGYLTYKFNLLGDGEGIKGTRQPDSNLEKWIFKHLKRLES